MRLQGHLVSLNPACSGLLPGSWVLCGEVDNYCSDKCWVYSVIEKHRSRLVRCTSWEDAAIAISKLSGYPRTLTPLDVWAVLYDLHQ